MTKRNKIIFLKYKNIYYFLIAIPLLFAACYISSNKVVSSSSITIAFAGDTMLGRLVNEVLQEKGSRYIWGDIIPLFHQADLRIINLETTFTRSKNAVPKAFNFKSNPENVTALQEVKIDLVNLANNHSKDFGNEGLHDTIITLNRAAIEHVGAGKNMPDARAPIIINKNGIRIGIIGATDNEPTWAATKYNPGINYFQIDQLSQLLSDIKELKKQVDMVIVSLHWGPNMRKQPTEPYIAAAHTIIDAGADIIHGHSSHIFQGIEIYKNKLILYDTGDLIDDYQVDPVLRNDRSLLFFVTITKHRIISIQLIPIFITMMQVNLAQEPTKTEILHRIKTLSQKFGTQITNDGLIII